MSEMSCQKELGPTSPHIIWSWSGYKIGREEFALPLSRKFETPTKYVCFTQWCN